MDDLHGKDEWVGGWMDGWMDGRTDWWMGGWMDGWMDGWTDEWVYGGMDGWVDGRTDRRTDGRMDGWMGGWMDGRTDGCNMQWWRWSQHFTSPDVCISPLCSAELSLLFSCWRVSGRGGTGRGLGCWDGAAGSPDVEKPTELFCCLWDEVKPITYIIFIIIFNTVQQYFLKLWIHFIFYHCIIYTIHICIIFNAFYIYFCCEWNHYIV